MKRNQKFLSLFALLSLVCAGMLSSCKKDSDDLAALVSNSEAAEMLENSLSSRTSGFTMPAIDAAQIIEASLNNCNVPGDTTLSKTKSLNGITYNYTFNMDWLLTCNNFNLPQSAVINIAGNGNFNTQRWAGTDVTSGNLTYTGLELQAPAYIVNGSYDLEGNLTGSFRQSNPSFNCITEINLSNLSIDKTDLEITGGTGAATIIANASNGATQTLNAQLVFNGNGTVTVTVNGYSQTFPL
jgi:hypothetical protein